VTPNKLPHDAEHRTVADLLDWKNYAENYPSGVQPYLESSKENMPQTCTVLEF